MAEFIDKKIERPVIVGLTALTTLFGFEILHLIIGSYQLEIFILAGLAVWLFLVAMQTFIFDLHIKRTQKKDEFLSKNIFRAVKRRFRYLSKLSHWLHFQNYLILPGIIFWSTVSIMFLNPFNLLVQQAWIILSTLALSIVYWYLKKVFYNHKAARHITKQHIFIVKIYASYVAFVATFGLLRYFGYDAGLFGLAVFAVTFLLLHQAMFQHHFVGFETLKFLLIIGGLIAVLGILTYVYWPANYFTGALVLTAVYNTIWGLVHHKFLSKNLTRALVYEYVAVLFLVLVIVFSITNFGERI